MLSTKALDINEASQKELSKHRAEKEAASCSKYLVLQIVY